MRIHALAATALLIASAVHADTVVFTGVNVITLQGDEILENQTVRVTDGKIESVGPPGPFSGDARVVDSAGKYLMPGLAEMHAHIPNSANRQNMEEVLTLYLSQGITTIRGMLGEPGHLKARDDQIAGTLDAPRIIAGGPSLNGNSVSSPEQGARMVAEQHQAGYDHLKIHPGLSKAEFDAIAGKANELGIKFAGHVSPSYGALHALASGQQCIDHIDGFITALIPEGTEAPSPQFFGINLATLADPSGIDALAAKVAEANSWVVPTETLMVNLAGPETADDLLATPGMQYVSQNARNNWRQSKEGFGAPAEVGEAWLSLRRQLILAIHENGDRLLLGSDAPQVFNVPGFSIHRELAIYVQAGLSPAEALATGNVNVARYLGLEETRGRIEAGMDADLVLLDKNPLASIHATRSVTGVMVAGRWYDRDWIDEQLAAIAARHAP